MSVKTKAVGNNLPLPPDKMPKCWNEEERMNALFSPFQSKSANPQDWTSKYKFWQNLMYEWLKHNMQCSFSIADLNVAFKRKGCTPLCLTSVVEELLRNGEIIPETEFLKEPCHTWTSWSIDIFVKRPLVWSFSKVKSYGVSSEINKETRYIHLQSKRDNDQQAAEEQLEVSIGHCNTTPGSKYSGAKNNSFIFTLSQPRNIIKKGEIQSIQLFQV